ncbi:uncharacterized protein K444DRAFT_377557 [Hyaloscypha bicolor E]|uniref:Uncharacterized protein n=1 Tax=Hyaloscypha bicolor E TaxID=1095630 RepID=A0A2J6TFJ7_9HELO|nr:uncharacterized protein K444DRAFT_377557 [Hyaloscypha bicolor E]PMD61718.1 hypothetical protein K444DRAFT_377557 [Hyaloscypha bicolor E]
MRDFFEPPEAGLRCDRRNAGLLISLHYVVMTTVVPKLMFLAGTTMSSQPPSLSRLKWGSHFFWIVNTACRKSDISRRLQSRLPSLAKQIDTLTNVVSETKRLRRLGNIVFGFVFRLAGQIRVHHICVT